MFSNTFVQFSAEKLALAGLTWGFPHDLKNIGAFTLSLTFTNTTNKKALFIVMFYSVDTY